MDEYKELLSIFIEHDGNEEIANYEEIPCTWLYKTKTKNLTITTTLYDETRETQQRKPELCILQEKNIEYSK